MKIDINLSFFMGLNFKRESRCSGIVFQNFKKYLKRFNVAIELWRWCHCLTAFFPRAFFAILRGSFHTSWSSFDSGVIVLRAFFATVLWAFFAMAFFTIVLRAPRASTWDQASTTVFQFRQLVEFLIELGPVPIKFARSSSLFSLFL